MPPCGKEVTEEQTTRKTRGAGSQENWAEREDRPRALEQMHTEEPKEREAGLRRGRGGAKKGKEAGPGRGREA